MENASLPTLLFASARASVRFALDCLEPYRGHLRAKSSFVDPNGEIMHWHEFGDLEGPGWAANALGGAALLYRWGSYVKDDRVKAQALALVDHVLEDGFTGADGFIWPYYELAQQRFCLNYAHNDDWLCPGSLAKIGTQMLELADLLPGDERAGRLESAAQGLAAWIDARTPRLANGWVPRRITIAGEAYPKSPTGGPDPIFDHSADGLYLLELFSTLAERGGDAYREKALALGEVFVSAGGFWGSINHDTYDDHESVAYSVAFRVLTRAAQALERPAWEVFARQAALPALERYRMQEDRHGVATRGLLWMEESWDTAYLWESAEAAQAYLESWLRWGDETHRQTGLEILRAIANHHSGPHGFVTEGVDWNNHVTRRHHVRGALYGDINYTEPLLNHLHFVGPTLFYLQSIAYAPPAEVDDAAALRMAQELNAASQPPRPGAEGARYLLRLYYPALETEERVEQSLDFARRSGCDAALLFEASYDMDPALLTLPVLRERFARLKALVPRFRAVAGEVHINMMITLGHVDAGSARPERFDFQYIVNEHGEESRASACPLDPALVKRAAELYRMAAETGADAVWVDDDTRLVLHGLPGAACFCPLHLRAFSERTGKTWTREELAAALIHEAREAKETALREQWFDLQEEAILDLARVIEATVHGVNPDMRVGLMTIGTAFHAAEGRRTDKLLRALAGATRPLIRPGSGFWSDWTPAGVLDKTEDCARQIALVGGDVQAVSEVENHPYSPYLKSNRVLALELALDVLAGMPDLSLNLLTSMGGSEPLEPEGTDYAPFLKAQRPFLDALARENSGRLRRGVSIACTEDSARKMRLSAPDLGGWIEARPWEPLLARLGLPIGSPECTPQYCGAHWVAGEVARDLTDYDWQFILREGAVLDPVAARVLAERELLRGFGLLGVRALETAVNERLTGEALNGGRAGQVLPVYNHLPYQQLATWEIEKDTGRVLSRWLDVDGQDRGSALVLLEDPDGRRIALLPYTLRAPSPVLLNAAHREQWAAVLETVGRAPLPCRVTGAANLYPLAGYRPEDESWLIAVANVSADDAKALLALGFDAARVETLTPSGEWQPYDLPEGRRLAIAVEAFRLGAWRIQTKP